MKKWLFRLIWVPVLVVAVLFLVANRTPVVISLDPFNPDNPALSTPAVFLWVWLMLMLFVGLGIGSLGTWLSGREPRAQARDNRREIKALKKELAVMTARAEAATASADAPGDPQAASPNDPPQLEAKTL